MECVVNEEVKVFAAELDKLVKKIMDNPAAYKELRGRTRYSTATIKFKRSECWGMEKAFRKEFEAAGRVAHIIKRENDDGRTYTIRYRSNAFKVEASSTDLREAKRLFVAATNAEGVRV